MNYCIEHISPSFLKPFEKNARTHSKAQLRQLANCIRRFGFSSPVLVDEGDTIIAGHGRVAAASLLKLETVPIIRIDSLTPPEVRALRLADNRIAASAGWDERILADELRELELSLGEDVALTGFSTAEFDLALRLDDEDELLEPVSANEPAGAPTSRAGDIWHIGPPASWATQRTMLGLPD